MKAKKFTGTIHARRGFRLWLEKQRNYLTPPLALFELREVIQTQHPHLAESHTIDYLASLAWGNGTTGQKRYRVDDNWLSTSSTHVSCRELASLEIHGRWVYRHILPDGTFANESFAQDDMIRFLYQQGVSGEKISSMLMQARQQAKKTGWDESWTKISSRVPLIPNLAALTWWQRLLGGFVRQRKA